MSGLRIDTIINISLGFILLLTHNASGQEKQSPGFKLAGPPETASLEKELNRRLGVYSDGIWPRTEILQSALRGVELPELYISRLQKWLPIIIKKEYLPDIIDPNQFYGTPQLHGPGDFIIGELHNPKQNVTVQFQADGIGLVFTAISKNYFPNDVNNLTDADIIKAIASLVKYPEDKIRTISIEKKTEAMGDVDKKVLVCYGKLRSDGYDEAKPPFSTSTRTQGKMENVRTWWNYMTFWMTKGKIFFSATMVNFETNPSTLDPYVFKLNKSK
jgi:hypothetical protein